MAKNADNLRMLFSERHLWHRIVNGTDYPLPAVRVLESTNKLRKLGYLTVQEERALDELFRCNPLLFDFVFKRTLRNPASAGDRLPSEMFVSVLSKLQGFCDSERGCKATVRPTEKP
jgi:mannonate dehydratase